MCKIVETFFSQRAFKRGRTPFLVASPGVDHHIDGLGVEGSSTGRRWSLPTSPEIHLKKLLCQGVDRVYEMKTCFRDDLIGPQHQVEFAMLEWYHCYCDLAGLLEEAKELLQQLWTELSLEGEFRWQRRSLASLFADYTGFLLKPTTTREELAQWARGLAIEIGQDDSWNDIFFRIFIEKVEPHLGRDGFLFVDHWPHQQASLAQLNQEGWAERFEIYWQGVELANAYLEVNDPAENRRRFLAEAELRVQDGKSDNPWDEDFFKQMEAGMPPCAGIALGLDRLFCLLFNRGHLENGRCFPLTN